MPAELSERQSKLMADLGRQAVRVTELDDGFTVEFRRSATSQLQELIELEQQCCGFLKLILGPGSVDEEVRLTLTGPPGTKSFLRETMQGIAGHQKL